MNTENSIAGSCPFYNQFRCHEYDNGVPKEEPICGGCIIGAMAAAINEVAKGLKELVHEMEGRSRRGEDDSNRPYLGDAKQKHV